MTWMPPQRKGSLGAPGPRRCPLPGTSTWWGPSAAPPPPHCSPPSSQPGAEDKPPGGKSRPARGEAGSEAVIQSDTLGLASVPPGRLENPPNPFHFRAVKPTPRPGSRKPRGSGFYCRFLSLGRHQLHSRRFGATEGPPQASVGRGGGCGPAGGHMWLPGRRPRH